MHKIDISHENKGMILRKVIWSWFSQSNFVTSIVLQSTPPGRVTVRRFRTLHFRAPAWRMIPQQQCKWSCLCHCWHLWSQQRESWILVSYIFIAMINLWRDTADPVIHLFLVLDCHIVASFTNLENGVGRENINLISRMSKYKSHGCLQYLLLPYWLRKQNLILYNPKHKK